MNVKREIGVWTLILVLFTIVMGSLYFASQWAKSGLSKHKAVQERVQDERAVQRVMKRNLIPTPTPEVREVPVVDPELKKEVQDLKREVQSLR
jgi:hypothetical protein